jgi:hypothetical protein
VQGEDAPLLQAQPEARWTKNFIGFEEKFDLVP